MATCEPFSLLIPRFALPNSRGRAPTPMDGPHLMDPAREPVTTPGWNPLAAADPLAVTPGTRHPPRYGAGTREGPTPYHHGRGRGQPLRGNKWGTTTAPRVCVRDFKWFDYLKKADALTASINSREVSRGRENPTRSREALRCHRRNPVLAGAAFVSLRASQRLAWGAITRRH